VVPLPLNKFNPSDSMLGQYHPLDGTIEFYGRINSILKPTDVVLDLGAGRGAWFFEDKCDARRQAHDIKPRVLKFIGADVDPVVLTNPTTTENYVISDGKIPLPDLSVDVIIADHVLEHILNVKDVYQEVNRVLKSGGIFCARTPHKFKYVSLIASIIKNTNHAKILRFVQPNRKAADVFPTAYRLNTMSSIRKAFSTYQNYSYLYSAEPAYYFGNKIIYCFFSWLHRVLPKVIVSEIFVFLRKPDQCENG
jgi:ubiquinone/menaquinone biosynthesis C-methylase UbiE